MQRCPIAACVVTKTDLYPEWRRIVELDRGHLGRAGIDIPVIPVSSFLRLAARRDAAADRRVRISRAGRVPRRHRAAAARRRRAAPRWPVPPSSSPISWTRRSSAEKAVLERPDQAGQVVERLRSAAGRAAALASPDATWQQVLGDGLQDLVAEVEHDLAERLRTVLRDVESVIDDGDPKAMWDGIGIWLRSQVVAVGGGQLRHAWPRPRPSWPAEVGSRFALDAGEPVRAMTGAPPESLAGRWPWPRPARWSPRAAGSAPSCCRPGPRPSCRWRCSAWPAACSAR